MIPANLAITARYWIEKLGLQQHPEGGWYKEVYRSPGVIPADGTDNFPASRCFSTSIYFMLPGDDFSAFHRIKSDEIWHFYDGSPAIIYSISPGGILTSHHLGRNTENSESLQVVIHAGHWFGAKVSEQDSYFLAGCTVSPGFDFRDFEMGKRSELLKAYPQHAEIICQLTLSS